MQNMASMEAGIREKVRAHLLEHGVLSDLKGVVAGAVAGSGATKSALEVAQTKAVVAQAVAARVQQSGAATDAVANARDCLLHTQILGGRAFIEPEMCERRGQLRVCMQLGAQRCTSRPVPFATEPGLDGAFLLPLPLRVAELSGPRTAASGEAPPRCAPLLAERQLLHLLLLQCPQEGGAESLVSSVLVDWRRVLIAGRCTLSVELPGVGSQAKLPIGCLELRFELLPAPQPGDTLVEAEVMRQLKHERTLEVEAERSFFAYARKWWAEYLQLHPTHRLRPVKLFAMSELGVQRPVTCFVQPLRAGRLLDSSLQAAHFVSLIEFERSDNMAGSIGSDVWHSVHATLCRRRGDVEEHALLLCSLLVGFGLDAHVCVGTDEHGPHVWVMTRADRGVVFWESLSGRRHPHPPTDGGAPSPFRTIACAFNHASFFANVQSDDRITACSLAFEDATCWKSLDPALIRTLTPLPQAVLTAPSIVDRVGCEERVEAELRRHIEEHRAVLDLQCEWDAELEYLLAPALLCARHPPPPPPRGPAPRPGRVASALGARSRRCALAAGRTRRSE
jgi:centrosomal protein CEP76